MGLTLRQLVCSGVAIGLAVLAYMTLAPLLGRETASWVCIVAAMPIAAAGFFHYDDLNFEQFLVAVVESVILGSSWRLWKTEYDLSKPKHKKKVKSLRLNEYASTRRTRGSYKIPTSVQKSIPIDEIYADGTWRSGEVYSQMWSISDINYAMQSDDKKQDILAKMGRIYSNIPTDCWAQLCIVSQRMDEISFERDVLYHRANDGLDAYRVERNRLMKAYAKEIGNVKQQKYLILSTNKQNSKDARERLNQVQRNMLGELSNIGCKVCALDNNARLEVLHNFSASERKRISSLILITAPDWGRTSAMRLRRMQCAFAKTISRLTIPMPSA